MLFFNFELNKNEPVYIQIKNYIEDLITKGLLPINSKLPSTRELCSILNVSRNSVLSAYEELKTEGLVYSIKGQGTFVKEQSYKKNCPLSSSCFISRAERACRQSRARQ